jgi:hypothetical protein
MGAVSPLQFNEVITVHYKSSPVLSWLWDRRPYKCRHDQECKSLLHAHHIVTNLVPFII